MRSSTIRSCATAAIIDRVRLTPSITPPTSPARPPPRGDVDALSFDETALVRLRRFVSARARAVGVAPERSAELAVAVSELASNVLAHGHGDGVARVWAEDGHVLCEIDGPGHISDPLVDRLRPDPDAMHGRGVWIANQFCDLVQIRATEFGTTVRLHVPHA